MDWTDDGIVLSARKHGESAAIVMLLTRLHGRHAGLVRGGSGRRARGVYEPGNRVHSAWRARLPEHLGTYTCELVHSFAAAVLDDPLRLAALSAACALAEAALPEREPHEAVFQGLLALLSALESPAANAAGALSWPPTYVRWELMLLKELGFGLDLSCCAATGASDGLAYVSPKSGRAVSSSAGAPYRDRLLPLPEFLAGKEAALREARPAAEIHRGLELTGYFLERHVFDPRDRPIPAARTRLVEGFR
ncbi:MAG: DNA repair protein RecO [Alphaproteobacteria bacterium]